MAYIKARIWGLKLRAKIRYAALKHKILYRQ